MSKDRRHKDKDKDRRREPPARARRQRDREREEAAEDREALRGERTDSAIIRCPCGGTVRAAVSADGSAAYATCAACSRTLRKDLRTGGVTVVRGEPYRGAGSE